ncbi:MAG: DUF3179 domain-containing (seleno)protein [Spirochaetota bacterium]
MIGTLLASAGLAVALVVGLGRQFTVFAAWEPGLGIFRRYPQKRLAGALVAGALVVTALAIGSPARLAPFTVATGVLLAIAFLFRLEWMFPALDRVVAVRAEDAELPDDADVMLVEVADPAAGGSTSRAYPLDRMVIARHLVHDTVGSTPVVVTYCALCRTGLAFRSEVSGHPARFRVVGVFRRNLIMEDDVSGTLWQQATGTAIHGPHAGASLELLPAVQLPWGEAKRAGRSSLTIATEPPDAPRAPFASERGFALLQRATDRITVPGHTKLSDELPRRETVFGLVVNDEARAYPRQRCREEGSFTDTLGGVELHFDYDPERRSVRVTRADGLPPPVVEQHWWLGWNEFHPDTTVWEP